MKSSRLLCNPMPSQKMVSTARNVVHDRSSNCSNHELFMENIQFPFLHVVLCSVFEHGKKNCRHLGLLSRPMHLLS